MSIPYVPQVLTESLHKFLAITGLVLIFIPPLYTENEISKMRISITHLEAEMKIIELQHNKIINEDKNLTNLAYSKKILTLSDDSIDIRRKRIEQEKYSEALANIQFSEKVEIVKEKSRDIKIYGASKANGLKWVASQRS